MPVPGRTRSPPSPRWGEDPCPPAQPPGRGGLGRRRGAVRCVQPVQPDRGSPFAPGPIRCGRLHAFLRCGGAACHAAWYHGRIRRTGHLRKMVRRKRPAPPAAVPDGGGCADGGRPGRSGSVLVGAGGHRRSGEARAPPCRQGGRAGRSSGTRRASPVRPGRHPGWVGHRHPAPACRSGPVPGFGEGGRPARPIDEHGASAGGRSSQTATGHRGRGLSRSGIGAKPPGRTGMALGCDERPGSRLDGPCCPPRPRRGGGVGDSQASVDGVADDHARRMPGTLHPAGRMGVGPRPWIHDARRCWCGGDDVEFHC